MNTEPSITERLAEAQRFIAIALRKTEDAYMQVSDTRSHSHNFGEIKVQLRAAQMRLAEVIQAEPSKTKETSQTLEPSAKPSHAPVAGEVVITTDEAGTECYMVSRQDEEGRILSVIWERPATSSGAMDALNSGGMITRELLAEMASFRRNANRYNFLRKHFRFANDSMQELWFDASIVQTDERDSCELDSTIDAIMDAE